MLPVLRVSAEKLWTMRELISRIADDLELTDDERAQRIPSGTESLIASRVHWAKTYLKQAGLIEQPRRATAQITQRGRDLLATNPARIDPSLLQQYDEFRSFLSRTKQEGSELLKKAENRTAPLRVGVSEAARLPPTATPDDQIEEAFRTLEVSLRDALLVRILEGSPAFFEKLIIDLLLAMGYGGSRADAGEKLGGTGDGGVDGVIREDHLGLDRVYLQAKRYQPGNTVGSDAVQAFIGALHLKGSQKGVMITTSAFTKAATISAAAAGNLRVVLIDGEELTRLMVRFGVGVRIMRTIDIKRIDLDYFEDTDLE
jgi:restriction system protein